MCSIIPYQPFQSAPPPMAPQCAVSIRPPFVQGNTIFGSLGPTGIPYSSEQLPWAFYQGGSFGGGEGGNLWRNQMLAYAGYYFPRKSNWYRPDEFGCPPPDKCTKDSKYRWNEKNNTIGAHGGCDSDCQCSGTRICDMRFGTWGYCANSKKKRQM